MKDRKSGTLGATMLSEDTKRRKGGGSLNREIQAKIGKQLRAYYGALIEPTPDRFVELLQKLDKTEDKGSSE